MPDRNPRSRGAKGMLNPNMNVWTRSRQCFFRADWLCLWVLAISFASPTFAQTPKRQLKPTEAVIQRYEKLILRGDLLTPEGWKRASEFFTSAEPYPAHGEILVEWTGTHTLGEEWNDGSRAQVNTKWNDYYGTIDSNLKLKDSMSDVLPMAESFTLVFVRGTLSGNAAGGSDAGQGKWKIDTPLNRRVADLPVAIHYLEQMRDHTTDATLRKNAEKSIHALRRLRRACGSASAC